MSIGLMGAPALGHDRTSREEEQDRDIVVTAWTREERLVDPPASISVIIGRQRIVEDLRQPTGGDVVLDIMGAGERQALARDGRFYCECGLVEAQILLIRSGLQVGYLIKEPGPQAMAIVKRGKVAEIIADVGPSDLFYKHRTADCDHEVTQ